MYENETGLRVHAAQVIDINNCKYIFESISHLKKLGFSIIESGINHFDEWDKTKIAILFNQLDICFDYYISLKQNNDSLVWIFFEAKLENFFSTVNFYSCKAGLCSIFVTTNGNIYPCTEIDSTVKIGDIYKGLNVRNIRNFAHIRQSENQECLECLEYKHCVTSGCIMSNYEINGNIFKPVNIECLITKYVYNMFRNKLSKEQLSSFSEYFKEKERRRQWKQKII